MATVESGVWGGVPQGGLRFGTSTGFEVGFVPLSLNVAGSPPWSPWWWEFQDPIYGGTVPYFWPYFVGISPYIGLTYGRYLQFRFLIWPVMAPHQAIVPTSTMMDFYVGGGIDYAFLGVGEAGLKNPRKTSGPLHSALIDPGFFQWIGLRENLQKNQGFPVKIFPSSSSMIFGQADACGNVNVSNFAGRVPGVGGFADPRRVTFWSKFGEKLQPYTNQVLLLLLSNYQIIKLSNYHHHQQHQHQHQHRQHHRPLST